MPKLDPRVRGPYRGTSSRGLAVVEAEKTTKTPNDLLLQDALESDRQPRCQELQRQRKRQTFLGRSHWSAKTHGFHALRRRGSRAEPSDITFVSADPLLAQDALCPVPLACVERPCTTVHPLLEPEPQSTP